ncbi:MAG: hypothetical protein ACKO5Q_17480, partial [Microcystaceae cyanobacterium]
MATQSLNPILQTAIADVMSQLNAFAQDPTFTAKMSFIFGSNVSVTPQQFLTLLQNLPPIEVTDSYSSNEPAGFVGAFSAEKNTIYLEDYLLASEFGNQLRGVLLESIGHYLDTRLNTVDAAGDDGALFSILVQGLNVSTEELARIHTENDSLSIYTMDGQSVNAEDANVTEIVWSPAGWPDSNESSTATSGDDFIMGWYGTLQGNVYNFANMDNIQLYPG